MRIIEPKDLALSKQKRNRRRVPRSQIAILGILVGAMFILGWISYHKPSGRPAATFVQAAKTTQPTPSPKQSADSTGPKVIRNFTGPEFLTFYNTFAYPNVHEITDPPPITGDPAADEHIRVLALQRGYVLRSIAVPPIGKVDNYPLQNLATQPWIDMKAAAAKDGVGLSIVAGFRSVEDQRTLFLERLELTGATAESISAGDSDEAVIATLTRTALPGYTRHHTGYTVDIGCSNSGVSFGQTICFQWLSKDNYLNAKRFGWIPSYPDGAPNQGPEPEPWEYVWVGVDALYEPASTQNIGG